MNHYPMYPSSHSVRARSCISVLVRHCVCVCLSASEGLPVWIKAEPLVWRWSAMMRTSVMCPAVIWLDIKIRVTTRKVAMSYSNIQYTKRHFSTRGHLMPEYCCSVPEGG